jgi:tRNA-2-methylthio-N6-dimethylallyladenosine synthase
VEEVLVEGESKKDPRRRSGRTRQGKLVHFEADEHGAPVGTLLDVVVADAAPHWLAGDMVGAHRRSGRTRIPVTAG